MEHSLTRETFLLEVSSSGTSSHKSKRFNDHYDVSDYSVIQSQYYRVNLETQCALPISPMPVGINCMAFNHNSSLLITGGTDGIIRLFGK